MTSVPNIFLKSSLVAVIAVSCSLSGAFAAKTSPPQKTPVQHHVLSNSELVEILRTAKVIDASYGITATQTGDELIVSTQLNPKFNENDTKVQGVLIAKTAFDVLPESVQKTKILFHNLESDTFNEVLINRTVVETYGKGLIDEKKLLGSLELEKKGGEPSSEAAEAPEAPIKVVDGPLQEERLLALTRIQFMKKRGAELSIPEGMFAESEKLASANDRAGVKAKLSELKLRLDEQRGALASVEKTQRYLLDHPSNAQSNVQSNGRRSFDTKNDALKGKDNRWNQAEYIRELMHFLSSRNISVSRELQEFEATSILSNVPKEEKKARRKQLLQSLSDKLSKLPSKMQEEFKNSERSLGASSGPLDNVSTSQGQNGQQPSNVSQATEQPRSNKTGNPGSQQSSSSSFPKTRAPYDPGNSNTYTGH
jgi:hypothetical protein